MYLEQTELPIKLDSDHFDQKFILTIKTSIHDNLVNLTTNWLRDSISLSSRTIDFRDFSH